MRSGLKIVDCTAAESYLLHAEALRSPGVLDLSGYSGDVGKLAARIVLSRALELRPSMALRAIVEEWGPDRIVREIY